MNYRILGAILVIVSSGGMGFSLAAAHKREENALKQLLRALGFMACELEYRLPPLDQLCAAVAGQVSGVVRSVFTALSAKTPVIGRRDITITKTRTIARIRFAICFFLLKEC